MVTNTSANGTGGIVYKLTRAVLLSTQYAGNALDISWTVTPSHLEAQTNDPALGLSPNWFPVPGSAATNHMILPVNSAAGSVFYRLAVP